MVSSADEVLGILRGIAPRDVSNDDAVVVLPQLRLDSDRRIASWFGDEVDLTPLEYAMLACLLSKPGRMWSFEALYERVWHTAYLGNRAEIHSLVKRLRGKLRQLNNSLTIEAIRGVGFRLVLPAQ
jgi:DNA-binding response OmpR family regulator